MYKIDNVISRIKDSEVVEEYKKEKIINILEKLKSIRNIETELDIDYLSNIIFENSKLGFRLNEHKPIDYNSIKYLSILEEMGSFENLDKKENKIDNFLIIGDNMDSLRNLSACFKGDFKSGVDLIYIDPPYNVRNNQTYENDFDYNDWLFEIKEKMIISKSILKETGSIMISIDDNMHSYLKVIMDEVFGEKNFLGNFVIGLVSAGRKNKAMSKIHEYVLIYSKNIEHFIEYNIEPNGKYSDFLRTGSNSSIEERPNRYYPILIDKNYQLFPIKQEEYDYIHDNDDEGDKNQQIINIINRSNEISEKYRNKGFDVILPISNTGDKRVWQRKFSIFKNDYQNKIRVWNKNSKKFENIPCYRYAISKTGIKKIEYTQESRKPLSMWLDKMTIDDFYNHIDEKEKGEGNSIASSNGKRLMNQIFTKKEIKNGYFFSSPKPLEFMKRLIKAATYNNPDALILDFFGGSGTTAHAVLEINKEEREQNNKSNRRFIICTRKKEKFKDEQTGKYMENQVGKICYERIYRIMNGKSSFKTEEVSEWCQKNEGYGGNLYSYEVSDINIEYNSNYSLHKIKKEIYEKISNEKIENNIELINKLFKSDLIK